MRGRYRGDSAWKLGFIWSRRRAKPSSPCASAPPEKMASAKSCLGSGSGLGLGLGSGLGSGLGLANPRPDPNPGLVPTLARFRRRWRGGAQW